MNNTFHIVFAGGGTGGHLFPGLAVAKKLSANRPGVRITFAGTAKPLERQHVAAAGFDYVTLPSRPLPKRGRHVLMVGEAISFVVENVAGYFAAGRLLDEENVAGVVGLGGYASVPMGRAAARAACRWYCWNRMSCRAKRIAGYRDSPAWSARVSRETELRFRWPCSVRWTGNPIRSFEERLPSPSGRAVGSEGCLQADVAESPPISHLIPHPPRLVVLGGSGGARSLNENVPRALYKVRRLLGGWEILHQSGDADLESTRELYRKFGLEARVEAFWPDLPVLLSGSSLAICRAGGTTLAELSAAGTPAVLLPYPHATDDHQRKNADVFAAAGAAQLVDEREVAGRLDDHLAELLNRILIDADGRAIMAHAMRRMARPHAAAHVATLVWSLVSSQARTTRAKAAA